jgi:Cu/Zn superoxide dismutase
MGSPGLWNLCLVGKEGGALVPLDIHHRRETLDKRHPGDLHVNLSVEAYSTGHPGVLNSRLDEEEPGRKHLVVLHSHLD